MLGTCFQAEVGWEPDSKFWTELFHILLDLKMYAISLSVRWAQYIYTPSQKDQKVKYEIIGG